MLKIATGKAVKGAPNTETVTVGGHEVVLEISYVGCVLSLREMNGYNDSDFYATVWDHATGRSKEIEYATTRGWTYANHASIDATDEVKALYDAEQAAIAAKRKAAHDAEVAKMPKIGEVVEITGGRKLQRGVKVEVFWMGKDSYQEHRRKRYASGWECLLPFTYEPEAYRVGVRTLEGRKEFVSAKHVKKLA